MQRVKVGLNDALLGAKVLLGQDEDAKTKYLQKTMAYWTKLAYCIHHAATPRVAAFYEVSDVLQDVLMRLLHALRTHDAERGPLGPHVWHVVWRDCTYAAKSAQRKTWFLVSKEEAQEAFDNHSQSYTYCNRAGLHMLHAATTEEEVTVAAVLAQHGVDDFPYEEVCARIPWWSENRQTQRKSFKRVVQSCAARMGNERAERN